MYISRPTVLDNSFCKHTDLANEPPSAFQINAIKACYRLRGVSEAEILSVLRHIKTAKDAQALWRQFAEENQKPVVNKIVVV